MSNQLSELIEVTGTATIELRHMRVIESIGDSVVVQGAEGRRVLVGGYAVGDNVLVSSGGIVAKAEKESHAIFIE